MAEARVIIVVGASTGGLAALRVIAAGLPAGLPAAVCVVQHIGAHYSHLPGLLARETALPVLAAQDGDPIQAGHIYCAPPDYHLIVGPGHLHLTRGPKENFARPAIDPLFRSAAETYGPNAIGVVLTGQLNDGTAGLYEIKRRGGVALVQDPGEAESREMPLSAIGHVAVDHVIPAASMPILFGELASRLTGSGLARPTRAKEAGAMQSQSPRRRPSALTCPECGGALRRSEAGTLVKFDCHIGHVLTAETMAAGQLNELEKALESALRRMNERAELCRQMAEVARAIGRERQAGTWELAQQEADERVQGVAGMLSEGWTMPLDDSMEG